MTQQLQETSRKKPLRIAMIGLRGLPADLPKAGGGERETEAKASRLAQRGHQITVYCRWHYNRNPESPYKGIKLISLPSLPSKNFDTPTHTLLATLHAIFTNQADIVSYHGMGNALFLPLVRLAGKKSIVYMDGVDWDRPKWGRVAKWALKLAARWAYLLSDVVYVDNRVSQQVFARLFNKEPLVITLAADLWEYPGSDMLAKFGLEKDRYILFVGLLKPDKGVHLLIEAYRRLNTDIPLVIVGDSVDEPEYKAKLKSLANDKVHFLGFVYGQEARQLFANTTIYVQPSIMEGNSPSLMSAMACGRCVVVNGIEQNLETIGDAGLSFDPGNVNELAFTLQHLINSQEIVRLMGEKARSRIEKVYNWDLVIDQLEQVYQDLNKN